MVLGPKQKRMTTELCWHDTHNGRVWGAMHAVWDGKPKRAPRKGEWFISGAIPVAYKAKQDMNTEYYIAVIV